MQQLLSCDYNINKTCSVNGISVAHIDTVLSNTSARIEKKTENPDCIATLLILQHGAAQKSFLTYFFINREILIPDREIFITM